MKYSEPLLIVYRLKIHRKVGEDVTFNINLITEISLIVSQLINLTGDHRDFIKI